MVYVLSDSDSFASVPATIPGRMRVADQNPPPHHTIFGAQGTWEKIGSKMAENCPMVSRLVAMYLRQN
jgi:hypothetical protein